MKHGPTLTAREKRINDDYDWCLHDPEVRKAYSGQVVVAHKRTIWGAGKNHMAAWKAASKKPGCPPRKDVAFVALV